MKYSYNKCKIILVLSSSFFFISCDIGDSDVRKTVANIKKNNTVRIEQVPKLKEYPQASYESEKLGDPFEIAFGGETKKKATLQAALKRPDHDRPREYLENYPLDSLVMVGTLQKRGIFWGLIVDKNGTIHRVKEGNYLGQNSGRIVKITERKIEVAEIVPDLENGWKSRNATLSIKN